MPIDPTIIPTKQTLPNFGALPATLQDLMKIQQGGIALQNAQMEQAANQAASEAFRQNTDPQTGQINAEGALAALANSPYAGYNVPKHGASLLGLAQGQTTLQDSRIKLVNDKLHTIGGAIGGIVSLGDKATRNDVINNLQDLISRNVISTQEALDTIRELPKDDSQVSQWAKNNYARYLDHAAQINLLTPGISQVDTGSNVLQVATNRLTGQPTVVGAFERQLSPSDLAQPVQIIGPDGEQRTITRGQFLQLQGVSPTGKPIQGGGMTSGGMGVQTGFSPEELTGRQTTGSAAAGAAAALHNAVSDAPMRLNYLKQAVSALENPDLQTGPGTDWRNQAKSFINALAPDVSKKIGFRGDIADYDEFKKIMTNYASLVSGSVGTGTDSRLNAAITGNANPEISKLANQDILTKTIAAEKMRQIKDLEFQNSGLTPDKFNKWEANWNRTINPDVFAFDSMNREQATKFIERLQKQGKNKVEDFYKQVEQYGKKGYLSQ